MRRQRSVSKGLEISSDTEREAGDDSDFGTYEVAINSVRAELDSKGRNRHSRRVIPTAANDSTENETAHPPCPEGFDPAKWAKMTLEEKCKHLGIDVNEWLRMSREQQLQRMHNLAKGFHFYYYD